MKFDKKIYWISFWIIRAFYRTILKGDVQGLNNVPTSGPIILASNHASHLDPPLLGCSVFRIVTYFARKTLWKPGLGATWMTAVGAIPIDRDGASDIKAMKSTLRALKNGGVLTLFPEGTRSPDGSLQTAKPGIGLIAAKSQAAVVPCRIFNAHKALSKASKLPNFDIAIHIVYGKPLHPEDYDPGKAAGKARYQQIADNIMTAISEIKRPQVHAI
jgi:1-acyl-sn-glycerol-3-phosphate acyltransferase